MKGGLGQMPLTLWVIVAAVILYLYIRRANVGIDLHPGEAQAAPANRPSVTLPPVLPPVPGTFAPPPLAGQPGGPSIIIVPTGPTGGGVLQ